MKHNVTAFVLTGILCPLLAACGQPAKEADTFSAAKPSASVSNESSNTASVSAQSRIITDLDGNTVKIPAASEIKHIVIISPPVMSFVIKNLPDTGMIVGINSRSFTTSNTEIVKKVFPDWKNVNTSFIDSSFAVNKESLMELHPDIIFYYGNVQKRGLKNIDIPSVDFFSKQLNDPEEVSIAWDKQICEILGQGSTSSLQDEWTTANKKLSDILKSKKETKTALCVFSNTAGKVVVSGSDSFDSYAQSFFDKAEITNVAANLNGTSEVSMEQIYKWNPDMILVFHDSPAQAILENSIEGQDWSLLDAWKSKAVYDVPRTTYSWITPCADSPLMPLWLVSKAYPDLLDENSMDSLLSSYYQRNYKIDLIDSDIRSILDLRKATTR
ncbi:hypothetical protein CAFE_24790 [Caprobacter fermentans]|uniref:ABC transporter substrate-binding protein n=1 Tax=Caproicibacter fermentans TaxID=2576756 RepID=A0A6N8I0V4_9FIRM|nr:ABC transporter substrate-binding protein [Caproicibacter fermentans]MVB11754.1 hypothetical protein [Caproicibacter fermentans]QNK39804.1 ABC transporter substrate-binding protein [Caproicibacter fermentans]